LSTSVQGDTNGRANQATVGRPEPAGGPVRAPDPRPPYVLDGPRTEKWRQPMRAKGRTSITCRGRCLRKTAAFGAAFWACRRRRSATALESWQDNFSDNCGDNRLEERV